MQKVKKFPETSNGLLEILSCPACLGMLSLSDAAKLKCSKCAKSFAFRGGAAYFTEVKKDITPDDNRDYVESRKHWSAWRKKNYAFYSDEMAKVTPGSTVIDVGAGPGFFNELFENHHYYAMDFYSYQGIHVVTDFVQDRLPLRSNIADVVILSNVLEHLSKPEPTLLECSRILKPGGTILITVPFLFKIHQQPYDFCRYTHFKLQQLLEENGLKMIQCRKLGSMWDLLGSIKYEFSEIAAKNTRYKWLLRQALRLDYHLNNIIRKFLIDVDDNLLTEQAYFVGYSCVAKKRS